MKPIPIGQLSIEFTAAAARRNFIVIQRFMDDVQHSWPFPRGVQIKSTSALLTGVSGASVTATNFIPNGALMLGTTSRIVTALGTTNGTTGYDYGTAADPNYFGSATAVTAGTVTEDEDFTATTVQRFIAATNAVVTAVGGNFDGTGDILLTLDYIQVRDVKP